MVGFGILAYQRPSAYKDITMFAILWVVSIFLYAEEVLVGSWPRNTVRRFTPFLYPQTIATHNTALIR